MTDVWSDVTSGWSWPDNSAKTLRRCAAHSLERIDESWVGWYAICADTEMGGVYLGKVQRRDEDKRKKNHPEAILALNPAMFFSGSSVDDDIDSTVALLPDGAVGLVYDDWEYTGKVAVAITNGMSVKDVIGLKDG